ncbi:MAG TPA: DUF3422 domain-containing protein [Rhodocyclaceae bacterium]
MSEHTLRQRLNDELHARPPVSLTGPAWITHLVMLHEGPNGRLAPGQEEAHLHELCELAQSPFGSEIDGDHWILEAGNLRLKWERHNEFSSYTFFRQRQADDGPRTTALEAFPGDWCTRIPGCMLVATHVEYCTSQERDPEALMAELARSSTPFVATRVADGAALVVSDFRIHDGFTHYTMIDESLRHRQSGRTIQRLLEIETYRMMALLAFPVAKEVSRLLARHEQDTAELMAEMARAVSHEDERTILAGLTRLAAEVELSITRTAFRFGAAEAYYALVKQRITDLRGQPVDGFSSIRGFLDRRLAPAIQTCLSVARRQNELTGRIARKSALLRTRVDIELERQNQELLAQMNRRASLQLRLQETVEGLSVVAITYYASSLVHHLAEGLEHYVHGIEPAVAAAISIPLIAIAVAMGIRRMRRHLTAAEEGSH